MKKLIIEIRVNEYAMRDGNPHVPWTAAELGRDARAIRDAGASVIHFHARNDDGTPTHKPADYAAAIRLPRARKPTNADLVREIVRLAQLVGREIATPGEARLILGI